MAGAGRRTPTIRDVAARAGVSKSLVSLVMRGAPNVSEERRAAVLDAARELGYRPNAVARSLVRRRSHVIGVMLSDLRNPYFAEVAESVDELAGRFGYRALINSGSRRPAAEERAIETLLQLRVDGLILAGPVLATAVIARAAAAVPVSLVSRAARTPGIDTVRNDDRLGAMIAVDHLVSLGHRRIAHVDGGRGAGAEARRTGYRRAMERNGLVRNIRIVPGSFTEEGGYRGVERLLGERRRRPTAIFVANDLAAIGALQALEDAGREVPAEMSVIGYDNTMLASLRRIGLSTIDQPSAEIGATAVRLLLERIEEGRTEDRHIVLPPSLVVRETTAPPPR